MLTIAGGPCELLDAVRSLARKTVELVDITAHRGQHPRIGALDVVPFVPLRAGAMPDAVRARDDFARWAGAELALPCFLYGPLADRTVRTLPEVRRGAFRSMSPDHGPQRPHPSAGASAVGARTPLVAYNLWLTGGDTSVVLARRVASAIRRREVRALGLELEHGVQVSCNLVEPETVGPHHVYDEVAALLREADGAGVVRIERCELVGLVPRRVLEQVPASRRDQLGLSIEATIEARLEERGIS